jgi:hypothetical protein
MSDQRPDARRVVLGFVVAVALLVALLAVVGVRDVAVTLLAADPAVLGAIGATVVAWIGAWSGSLHLVFRAFDVPTTPVRSAVVFTTLMFWDNVTPFSTLAADPVAAWTVTRATGVAYEKALAAVVSVDTLNFVPSPVLALVALVSLRPATVVTASTATTAALRRLAVGLVVLVVLAGSAWRYRRSLAAAGSDVLSRVARLLGRLVPGTDWTASDPAALRRRASALVSHLETVAASPRTLVGVTLCATVGWLLLSAVLWLSLLALGAPIPATVAILLIPLATVAEVAPVPGGVGGFEPVAVALLVATTTAAPPVATAGVLLFRAATYWLPTIAGGAAVPLVSR